MIKKQTMGEKMGWPDTLSWVKHMTESGQWGSDEYFAWKQRKIRRDSLVRDVLVSDEDYPYDYPKEFYHGWTKDYPRDRMTITGNFVDNNPHDGISITGEFDFVGDGKLVDFETHDGPIHSKGSGVIIEGNEPNVQESVDEEEKLFVLNSNGTLHKLGCRYGGGITKWTMNEALIPQNMERDHMLLVKRRLEEIQEVFEGYKDTEVRIF